LDLDLAVFGDVFDLVIALEFTAGPVTKSG